MYESLKNYCQSKVSLTPADLALIDRFFETKQLQKGAFLLEEGHVCDFIAFIAVGTIRHFHTKQGNEKTCDLSFENAWVTDFQSFTHDTPGIMNLQAMEEATVFFIKKDKLSQLYKACNTYETFGRLMAEQVAQRATEIAMSLSSDKPEERFLNLIEKQSTIFQRVPQKYIANFLGISPESLSRIRKRIIQKQKS